MTYERRRSHPRCDSSSPLSHQNVCQLVANITSHGRATAPTSSLQRPLPISRQATRSRCAHLHRYVNPPLDRLLRPFARGPLAHVFLSWRDAHSCDSCSGGCRAASQSSSRSSLMTVRTLPCARLSFLSLPHSRRRSHRPRSSCATS